MPATLEARPRERLAALAAVALIQLGLALALVTGLRVDVVRQAQAAEQLIAIVLAKPPPPPPPPPIVHQPEPARRQPSAASPPAPPPRPIPNPQPPPTPRIALKPTASPTAGGSGAGQGASAGAGLGNAGSEGSGDGGGTDMVQIAGSIEDSDMPRHLRDARFSGRVSFIFTVEPTGRVGRCSITRSSGVPELDQLTCRLIQQRFRYRPSTDRNGRPIAEEVDGDEDWGAR